MFGKVFAGIAAAGVLAGVLATGAMAAPAATTAASPAKTQRPAVKDVFGGTVTAISDTQLTVKNSKAGSKTFLRTDATVVVKGRNEKASWSEIEVNSHVAVRYEAREAGSHRPGAPGRKGRERQRQHHRDSHPRWEGRSSDRQRQHEVLRDHRQGQAAGRHTEGYPRRDAVADRR